MIHSSYKSLIIVAALSALGVGCALPSEGSDSTGESSSADLRVDNAQVKPQAVSPVNATQPSLAQQQVTAHPVVTTTNDAPRMLAGPKPNPWGDDSNTNSGSGNGTNTSNGSSTK